MNRGNHAVWVRNNLYRALKDIRHGHKVRVLWIDAICINQDYLQDKDYHVPLMRRIYSTARNVII